jgi:hypothetical protein
MPDEIAATTKPVRLNRPVIANAAELKETIIATLR